MLSDIGMIGDYSVDFYNDDYTELLGNVSFYIGGDGVIYTYDYLYDDSTEEWESILVETDALYFEEYDTTNIAFDDNDISIVEVLVCSVPLDAMMVEIQYLNDKLSTMDSYCETTINGDGTVTVDGVVSGYYTLNYDSDYTCIGYTSFYVDDSGNTYTYTFENDATEPTLSAISDISCTAINTEEDIDYTFGEMSVSVYGVPEEVDSISAMYYTGDEADEVVLFEPGYSSVYTEPLIVSELGMEGHYKLSFYLGDEILGNAEFYLDEDGTIYEYDYEFNDQTNEWEQCLSETDEIYYSKNTDIEDSDDYAYGNISLDITNVLSDVAYVDTYYYENDDTFTTGCEFFPEITISNGKASITNLGKEGYYEVYLLASDGKSMLGHVFFYMNSDSDIYFITYEFNGDTNQMETIMTQTESIVLEEYADSTVDYQSGDMSVTIYEVPETVNRILVACVADDETYSSFEKQIWLNDDNTIILDELGMAGNYTVTFMMGKDTLGSAMFYLEEDGEIYDASYVYDDDGNVNEELTVLDKIVFVSADSSATAPLTVTLLGNADVDGNVDIADATLVMSYVNNSSKYPITAQGPVNADVNANGNGISNNDALAIQRLLSQVIDSLPESYS
ncbi:MAG: dockerin type I repeat-containing protein [Ruminococcus sp.]|nr:dockerin type I repeat-containing protein [Ruminococcus sp.]